MPAFDPENPRAFSKLTGAVEKSKRLMLPFAETRFELMRRMTGPHYGDQNTIENRPINMIELGLDLFQRGMSSHAPQAAVSSNYIDLLPCAANMELALNQELTRINLKDGFNTCALEALIGMGVMLVGITAADTPPDGEGHLYDPGHLFADPVLFDDLILDMAAKTWDQQGYIGHDYVVPFDWVKENQNFNPMAREKLTAPEEDNEDSKSNSLSRSSGAEEFEDTICLRQLFLPRQQLIVCYVPTGDTKSLLQVIEWKGPERGPYHPLSLGKVPGNIMPLPPALAWFDLDDIINKNFRKAADQAERQKTIALVAGHAKDDGNRVLDAKDGDMILSDDPKGVQEVNFGGANQSNLGIVLWAKQMLSWLGGNWEALGGLAAQSGTVGQDKLLAETASGRMKDMQQTMIEFQSNVVKDMAFWLWEDPISEYHIIKPIEGTQYTVQTKFSPENRQGRFFDYNFSVSPYSAVDRSPSEQANMLMQTVQQFILPIMPALQQQGMDIDFEYLLKTLAKLTNQPELKHLIRYSNGEANPSSGPVGQSSMPSQTQRTYVRENRPGATQSGNERTMMNLFSGGNPQESEMANMFKAG